MNDDIDAELAKWVKSEREKKLRISRRMIQAQAMELFKKKAAGSSAVTFRASIGWLQKFLNRHNFRLRRPTTVCQKPPDQYEKTIVNFIMFMRNKRREREYQFGRILAANETAVWLDASSAGCIDQRGMKYL